MRGCCDRLQWTLGTRHTDRDDITVTQVHIVRGCCDRLQWTLGTRHTDRDDMQFKVVFLVALISVNTI